MRFYEFKPLLKEDTGQVIAVGDSLAVGVRMAGAKEGGTQGGINPTAVLNKIKTLIQSQDIKGATVIIGTGVPNNPGQINLVPQQISAVAQAGGNPVILGAGPKFDKYNSQLQSIASQSGAKFVDIISLDSSMAKGDGVHPSPAGYKAILNVATGGTAPTKPQSKTDDKKESSGPLGIPDGRRNKEVRDIQQVLVKLGYDVGPPGLDGIRGPYTTKAVQKFQADWNKAHPDQQIRVDGDPQDETVGVLNQLIKDKGISFEKSTDTDVKQYGWMPGEPRDPQDIGDISKIPLNGKDIEEARSVCEKYAGQELSDKDWAWLIKTLVGESANNAESYGWCTAVILNRLRTPNRAQFVSGGSGTGIERIVTAYSQFEAITGASGVDLRIPPNPTSNQMNNIIKGIKDHLSSVPHSINGFTSTNASLYHSEKGRNFMRWAMDRPDAHVTAGTVFFSA